MGLLEKFSLFLQLIQYFAVNCGFNNRNSTKRYFNWSTCIGPNGSDRGVVYPTYTQQRKEFGYIHRNWSFFIRFDLCRTNRFWSFNDYLAGFGAYIYRQNPAKNLNLKKPKAANHIQDLISAFFLTLSNPLILFFFIGLFARFNFYTPESQLHDYIVGYASIISGAFLWWLTITYFINKVRSKFNLRSLWIINRCIGTIIMLMSAYGFISGVYNFFN